MSAAMKNPMFHQGNLFIVRGYDVLLYTVNENELSYQDYFSFPDPVENIEVRPAGLVVSTAYEWYLVSGGPFLPTYFTSLLAKRTPGAVLTLRGTVYAV
jgi:hypothetical protein